jgi:hypothetical protein
LPGSSAAIGVTVRWDQAGLSRVDRFLGTYEGKQLTKRIDKAFAKELRPLTGKLKSAEKASGIHNRTGEHYRKIRMRKPRLRAGEVFARTVGPSDRKRHLLLRGHRIVTPGGRDTGRRSQAFPYVDAVIDRDAPEIMGRIGTDVWATQF